MLAQIRSRKLESVWLNSVWVPSVPGARALVAPVLVRVLLPVLVPVFAPVFVPVCRVAATAGGQALRPWWFTALLASVNHHGQVNTLTAGADRSGAGSPFPLHRVRPTLELKAGERP